MKVKPAPVAAAPNVEDKTPEPQESIESQETPETVAPTVMKIRVVTDRKPFFQGKPLPENAIVEVPISLANTLCAKNWAVPV
jgi:hypothetical protein